MPPRISYSITPGVPGSRPRSTIYSSLQWRPKPLPSRERHLKTASPSGRREGERGTVIKNEPKVDAYAKSSPVILRRAKNAAPVKGSSPRGTAEGVMAGVKAKQGDYLNQYPRSSSSMATEILVKNGFL